MKKILAVLIALVAVMAVAPPADAARDLRPKEAKRVVVYLLETYVAPAVASNGSSVPDARAWGCRTRGALGTCHGRLTVGPILCEGTFRVRKFRKGYSAWPLHMVCRDRRSNEVVQR